MRKSLRVRGEFHWRFKDFFLTEILSRKYDLQRVEKNADLVIGLVEPTPLTKEFKQASRKILVAGENLYYKINLFKFIEYISKKTKFRLNILNKLLPLQLLGLKIGFLRRDYLKYVKHVARNAPKGEYAIICNGLKGKNLLNIPFFLQVKEIRKNLRQLINKKNTKKIPKKFCCLVISNQSALERIDFAKKLSKYKKVDIYGGTSLTNSDNSLLPKCWDENYKFLSQYKFVICFENSFEEEYITEKLPNAMLANSIPIYRGAKNVSEYFNTNSFINFEDYDKSYYKMIEKIIELDKSDKKYLEFLRKPYINEENKKELIKKEKELNNFLRRVIEK